MKKSNVNWTIKRIVKDIDKGVINFDYPIQRAGGQWDNLQQSLLIHSVASDYPIPAIYTIVETEKVEGRDVMKYQVIDGKQRLTNLRAFLKGEFALHEDTPNVIIDGKSYELKERIFDELEEEVQDAITDFPLLTYKIEEYTDEEIEDLFFRLNNGTPLSKQQQAKGKMGKEWALIIKELAEHPFMLNKTSFTKLQLRKADNETALIQSMMLLDDKHELESISSNHVFKYTLEFKNDDGHKQALVNKIKKALDFLDKAFEVKESTILKKVHFPMTIVNTLYAIEKGITPKQFALWADEFKKALKGKSEIKTNYKSYSGAGSVKKHMALGRVEEMRKHIDKFFANYKEDKAPVAQQKSDKKVEPKKQEQKSKSNSKKKVLENDKNKATSELQDTINEIALALELDEIN
jgi:hypothetical protein